VKRLPQCSPTRNCKFLQQILEVNRAVNHFLRPFLDSDLVKQLSILFDLTTIYNNLHVDHPPKLKQSEYTVEEVKTQANHLVAQCSCFLLLNHETTQDNKAEEPLM